MSEIKVNKISPRTACGTTTLGDSGDTIAIAAGANATLGGAGSTITIPAGATITNSGTAAGFGATGAASWDTTVKTSGFTAVSGVGYFVNTTAGAISVNLPAGTAGDVVAIKDYANTFDTNNVTLVVNGSDKIGGLNINGTLSTEGLAVTLVYVDATQGWLVTDNGTQDTAPTAQYVTATGGTITCSGDYRIHTFTGPGTFCVSCAGNPSGSVLVDYMVVAGGGGGGGGYNTPVQRGAGGAGAGGFRESPGTASGSYSVSPLGATPAVSLPVTVQGYAISVGAAGAGGYSCNAPGGPIASNGGDSSFSTIISTGGGFGGSSFSPSPKSNGNGGGSGGGGSAGGVGTGCAGPGNSPPVSPAQGTDGGGGNTGPNFGGNGGGGATVAGTPQCNPGPANNGGAGGAGATTSISASPVAYAGGGGGGGGNCNGGAGGAGGGGGGGNSSGCGPIPPNNGTAGTTNTGGGGGGGSGGTNPIGGNGGSGIVIIRYKFQN